MKSSTGLLGRLSDPLACDVAYAGGKGASLAALTRAGLPVPDGFVVSTAAYRRFVAEEGLAPLIAEVTGDLDDLDAASARLRAAFEQASVPEWLREQLADAYEALGGGPVAVRSSATAEDLPQASFAGQQESLLNVVGVADLCEAVRRCWSSVWTARALAYRRQQDVGHEALATAVVVQRMVPAEVAGVLFTADPRSGRRDHLVVEAAAGLGEALVSGQVTPDRWVVEAATGKVLSAEAGGGAGAGPLLSAERLDALVDLGARAAALFRSPQDVEWAIAGGRSWVLQSRPITSLFPLPPAAAAAGPRVYVPLVLITQGVSEPLTPAGTAFFQELLKQWTAYWITGSLQRAEATPWLHVVAGRLYGDITPLLQRPRLAARVAANLGMKDPDASAVLRDWLRRNAHRLPRRRGALLPRGIAVVALHTLGGLVSSLVAPARTRRRMLATAEKRVALLERQAAALSAPSAQVGFVTKILPVRVLAMVTEQLAPVYAELLLRVIAERLVKRWLGTAAAMEAVRRWLPYDPTVKMGAELARIARTCPDPSPTDPEVERFLAGYGHRAPDREIDLGLPRLADDPAYVVELIRGYRRSGEALARFEDGAAEATAAARDLVREVRRAKGWWRALLLRTVLDRHHELGGLREQPKFDIVRMIALGRRTLRRVGVELVAQGRLDDPDDVFYLDAAELRAAAARNAPDGRAATEAPPDLGATVAGDVPDPRAAAAANRQAYRRELRRRLIPRLLVSDGETVYGAPATTTDGLTGTAVSPGVHEGVVRVLHSPVGAELRPGEVLVAASTDPGWTPLFLLAGALVMEVGGVISHGALVAREYGIPAVAGVAEATTRLRTGQRVRVDGENGVVTILDADDGVTTAPDAGDGPVTLPGGDGGRKER